MDHAASNTSNILLLNFSSEESSAACGTQTVHRVRRQQCAPMDKVHGVGGALCVALRAAFHSGNSWRDARAASSARSHVRP